MYIVDSPTEGKSSTTAYLSTVGTLSTDATLSDVDPVPGVVATITEGTPIPDPPETITTVTVPSTGETLTLSPDPENPEEGTFTYDPETGIITSPSIPAGEEIIYTAIIPTAQAIELEQIFPPDFLTQWQIVNDFSVNRTFQGHPTVDGLRFYLSGVDEDMVRNALCNGVQVGFMGLPMMVNSLKIKRIVAGYEDDEPLECEVSLIGIHAQQGANRSPLDTPKFKKALATNNKLALRSLGSYSGGSIFIAVPEDTSASESTTFRSEFESRAITTNSFVYYSGNVPELRPWGATTVHFLDSSLVISDEYEVTLSGFGTEIDGVKLVEEFNNVELNIDQESASDNEGEEDSSDDEWIELVSGDDNVTTPPSERLLVQYVPITVLENPKNAFDAGGKTKEQVTRTFLNGTLIKEVKKVYGFKFHSDDIYNVISQLTVYDGETTTRYKAVRTAISANVYWEQISEESKSFTFDAEGYLSRETSSGWRYARFKQESEKREWIEREIDRRILLADNGGVVTSAIQDSYDAIVRDQGLYTTWFKIPIEDETTYTLSEFRNYYLDSKEPDGDDPPPKFCSKKSRKSFFEELTTNPESTNDVPLPDLVVGKKFEEVETINIVTPGSNRTKAAKEIHVKRSLTRNQEGEGYKNALQVGKFEQVSGRPGEHSRLKRNLERSTASQKQVERLKYKYQLRSSGASISTTSPTTGSVGYPGISDPLKGKDIATTDLSIKNSKAAETFTLRVLRDSTYSEGDILVWRGKRYVILSIKDNIEVTDGILNSTGMELGLGRYLAPSVTLSQRRVEDE